MKNNDETLAGASRNRLQEGGSISGEDFGLRPTVVHSPLKLIEYLDAFICNSLETCASDSLCTTTTFL